jgi:hypothetical protein
MSSGVVPVPHIKYCEYNILKNEKQIVIVEDATAELSIKKIV